MKFDCFTLSGASKTSSSNRAAEMRNNIWVAGIPKGFVLPKYLFRDGKVGKDLEEDIPVRYLNFTGLVFTNGERDTWDINHHKKHIQHEWERYDHADALLRFRGAENCVVSGCQFINSGGGGVRLDLHCQHIIIEKSEFHHLGGCGVLLCGYGIGYKDVDKKSCQRGMMGKGWVFQTVTTGLIIVPQNPVGFQIQPAH